MKPERLTKADCEIAMNMNITMHDFIAIIHPIYCKSEFSRNEFVTRLQWMFTESLIFIGLYSSLKIIRQSAYPNKWDMPVPDVYKDKRLYKAAGIEERDWAHKTLALEIENRMVSMIKAI